MNSIRAKFRCNSVTYLGPVTDEAARTYEFSAVYDTSTEEGRRFAKATPCGNLRITVDNPAARFAVGSMYYLDFTAVPVE